MAGFSDVLKAIGYGAGAVTGGPSQVKAVAGAVAVQGKINSYLNSVGKSIGGIVGPDLFNKIASGAEVTANAETSSFVNKNVLTTQAKVYFSWGVAALLAVSAYFFYRGRS